MKRILFWDQSFHKKTRSSCFFSDLLEPEAEIVRIWDPRWQTGAGPVPELPVRAERFDTAIFWQMLPPVGEVLSLNCRSRVWVPMWDAPLFEGLNKVTRLALRPYLAAGLRVLCFCRAVQAELSRLGFPCLFAQYFPEVKHRPIAPRKGLSIFFWQRRKSPNWQLVKRLLGETLPDEVTIRLAPDPGCAELSVEERDMERYNISIARGWMRQTEYHDLLRPCNVFIAPRHREGIGISFLEAMALGMCVISADEATANEYITSGMNGLLYQAHEPRPVDLNDVMSLGQRARRTVQQGRIDWLKRVDEVKRFVFQG